MLTIDDVRAVPLFAGLADADLDCLVRTSADLRLHAGEYAVHKAASARSLPCYRAASRSSS